MSKAKQKFCLLICHLSCKNVNLTNRLFLKNIVGIIRDSEERYNLLNPTFFIFGEKDHTISYNQVSCCLGNSSSFPIVLSSHTEILACQKPFSDTKNQTGWIVLLIFQFTPYLAQVIQSFFFEVRNAVKSSCWSLSGWTSSVKLGRDIQLVGAKHLKDWDTNAVDERTGS